MKFICICEKLQEALGYIENIASKNETLPILETIFIQAQKNGLLLKATNLEIGVQVHINAKITQEGSIAIPAHIFYRFISAIAKDTVLTCSVDDFNLSIQTKYNSTKIKGFDTKDFPLIPQKKSSNTITLNPTIFKNALKKILFAASLNKIRPELTGVFMGFNDNKIRCATTDSFRLIETNIFLDAKQDHYKAYIDDINSVIIPKKTCQEVIRFLCDGNKLTVTIQENQIFFESDNIFLVSRLIEGEYPDYRQIIPQKEVLKVIVQKGEFINTLKRALIFSNKKTQEVEFAIKESELQLNALSGEYGTHSASIGATVSGEAQKITLNAQYILEGINDSEGEEIVIHITNASSPVLFYSVLEDNVKERNNFYIVMPVRQS